jgi:hypothetical protein
MAPSDNSFESGLGSINDQYATLSGIKQGKKGDDVVDTGEAPVEVDAEGQGLQPIDGVAKPKKAEVGKPDESTEDRLKKDVVFTDDEQLAIATGNDVEGHAPVAEGTEPEKPAAKTAKKAAAK